jgi:transcriptional regulator NrdR family protein
MVCIYCGGKTQVTNSRHQRRINQNWRRRECQNCHAVFTTEETVDYSGSIVVRPAVAPATSGSATGRSKSKPTTASPTHVAKHTPTQPFSRDKLFASLLKCLGHRATAIDDASALTATVIGKLTATGAKASITPTDIIIMAVQTLERFDTAAAVQYQAYHWRP